LSRIVASVSSLGIVLLLVGAPFFVSSVSVILSSAVSILVWSTPRIQFSSVTRLDSGHVVIELQVLSLAI
jgi:hypothetical protein